MPTIVVSVTDSSGASTPPDEVTVAELDAMSRSQLKRFALRHRRDDGELSLPVTDFYLWRELYQGLFGDMTEYSKNLAYVYDFSPTYPFSTETRSSMFQNHY